MLSTSQIVDRYVDQFAVILDFPVFRLSLAGFVYRHRGPAVQSPTAILYDTTIDTFHPIDMQPFALRAVPIHESIGRPEEKVMGQR